MDWWVSLVTQDTQSGTSQFDFLNVYSFMDNKGKIKKEAMPDCAMLTVVLLLPFVLFFIEPPHFYNQQRAQSLLP